MIKIKTRCFHYKYLALYIGFGVLLIRPDFADDEALLAHAAVHNRQFWKYLFMLPLLYKYSQVYRLQFEAEAYAAQLQVVGNSQLEALAKTMVLDNEIDVSVERAKTAILAASRKFR